MRLLFRTEAHEALPCLWPKHQTDDILKSSILSAFLRYPNKHGSSRARSPAQPVAPLSGEMAHARSGGAAPPHSLDQAKMLVFLSHCSNQNAVFAIPAGTSRHRHSLTARRAAWRRSERRRRNQRRRRARARPKRAGRSKVLAASSLRLTTVVDCVTRAGVSRRAVAHRNVLRHRRFR